MSHTSHRYLLKYTGQLNRMDYQVYTCQVVIDSFRCTQNYEPMSKVKKGGIKPTKVQYDLVLVNYLLNVLVNYL
jgi:hypothetical protein